MRNTTRWKFDDFLEPRATAAAPSAPILGMNDATAAVVVPIIAYWALSLFYETASYFNWFAAHRAHPTSEEKRRNLVTRWQTFVNVVMNHAIQLIFSFAVIHISGPTEAAPSWGQLGSLEYFGLAIQKSFPAVSRTPKVLWIAAQSLRWAWLVFRQLVAFFAFDTWEYWVHYTLHVVPWLYRRSAPPSRVTRPRKRSRLQLVLISDVVLSREHSLSPPP